MTRRRPTRRRRIRTSTLAIATVVLAAGVGAGVAGTATPTAVDDAPLATPSTLRTVHSPRAVTADLVPAVGACHFRTADSGAPLPDPTCTPGAVDPAVTQATLDTTICLPGWTATVRPSSSVTKPWRDRTSAAYNVTEDGVEYDHLVPLELGGANATSNLWIEPGPIPNPKDQVEGRLKALVCARQLTLVDAQQRIAADWTTALRGTRYATASAAREAGR